MEEKKMRIIVGENDNDLYILTRGINTFRAAQKFFGVKPLDEIQHIDWKSYNLEIGLYWGNSVLFSREPSKWPYMIFSNMGGGNDAKRVLAFAIASYSIWKANKEVLIGEDQESVKFFATRKRFYLTTVAAMHIIAATKPILEMNRFDFKLDINAINEILSDKDLFSEPVSIIKVSDMEPHALEQLLDE